MICFVGVLCDIITLRMIQEGVVSMATVSFDKSVVIEEPEAVDRLVDSLLNDEPLKVSENLLSEQEKERGERLLIQCLSRSNA